MITSSHPKRKLPPLAVQLRVHELCEDFEQQWKSHQRPTLSDYLSQATEEERPMLAEELLKLDLDYRRKQGETVEANDYQNLLTPNELEWVATLIHQLSSADGEGAQMEMASTIPGGVKGETTEILSGEESFPAIPGYTIIKKLDEGGMGIVYRAIQHSLGREVALKMIPGPMQWGADFRRRFKREAEALAQVKHGNVVEIYDYGEIGQAPYFSMELIEGGSLRKAMKKGSPVDPREAAEIIRSLANGIEAAHAVQIAHRDLKPENVLILNPGNAESNPLESSSRLVPEGAVLKITDFGLARSLDGTDQTLPGIAMGTIPYMAPEQGRGENEKIGPATDVYALGAILFELLTGQKVFKGSNQSRFLEWLKKTEPRRPRSLNKEIPRDLEAICLRCLEKKPSERYRSAKHLSEQLDCFLNGQPVEGRPWHEKVWKQAKRRPVLTVLLLVLLLLAGGSPFLWGMLDPERERKRLRELLQARREYRIGGSADTPGSLRQILGNPSVLQPNPDKSFALESVSRVFWELIDNPGAEQYRLSLEIRHDSAAQDRTFSRGGLYFGYQMMVDEDGERMGTLGTVTYSDVHEINEVNPRNRAQIEVGHWIEHIDGLYFHRAPIGPPFEFTPYWPVGKPKRWRKIILEVSPDGVEVSWGEDPPRVQKILEGSKQYIEKKLTRQKRYLDKDPELRMVPVGYSPHQGIGLYVERGRFSFRNLVLKRLPRAPKQLWP